MHKFNNKKVALLGFGMEGADAYKFLLSEGALISIFDTKEKEDLDLSSVNISDTTLYCGRKYDLKLLKEFDFVVRSPGIYRYLPEILSAEKNGVVITSPMNIFLANCPAKTIGVTGTKGKGTTSTLIYEFLKKSGFDAHVLGNIGKPCLALLPKLKDSSWVVLELSSFQLIDLVKSPHISVVLNITLDHMDWHKDREEYVDAKKNIILHQKSHDMAVINSDYPQVKRFQKLGRGKKYFFSKTQKVNGAYVKNNTLYFQENLIGKTEDLQLRGKHNWENVTAAICAAGLAGAKVSAIKSAVFAFRGLEHRLEFVGEHEGIKFYNDSFSTNPQTTIAALNSFTEPLTLILGGFDKNLNYDEMADIISKKHVLNCVLIGDIAAKIKKSLLKVKYKGRIIETGYRLIDKVIRESLKWTPSGGVLLLSPATSSFDMYKDYKARGSEFKEAVKKLGVHI